MKITHTVVSFPVEDLRRSQAFYREALGFEVSDIEDEMVTIEITQLSLYLIDKSEYQMYTDKVGMKPHISQADSAHIVSCAVESKEVVDEVLERVAHHGGHVEQKAKKESWGYTGYFKDPDGHLWELVYSK